MDTKWFIKTIFLIVMILNTVSCSDFFVTDCVYVRGDFIDGRVKVIYSEGMTAQDAIEAAADVPLPQGNIYVYRGNNVHLIQLKDAASFPLLLGDGVVYVDKSKLRQAH